jgi:hypothetical protein
LSRKRRLGTRSIKYASAFSLSIWLIILSSTQRRDTWPWSSCKYTNRQTYQPNINHNWCIGCWNLACMYNSEVHTCRYELSSQSRGHTQHRHSTLKIFRITTMLDRAEIWYF